MKSKNRVLKRYRNNKKSRKSKNLKKHFQKGGKKNNKNKTIKKSAYKTIVLNTKSNLKNFKNSMLNKGNWLILHHSHTCSHCVIMMPKWNKFKETRPKVNILEVEYALFDAVKVPEPIHFVPTIHLLNRNKKIFEEFIGKATPPNLKKFVATKRNVTASKNREIQKGSGEFKIIDKNIKENYNRDLLNNGKWLILYHSHNCPHCVDMMPEWQKFKDSKPEINVLEIESNDLSTIEAPTDIVGYPTLVFWNNAETTEFSGERTSEKFKEFVEKLVA